MNTPFHLLIGDDRRIALPAELCNDLGLHIGDTVIVRVEDDHATLSSVDHTIKRFQNLALRHLPEGLGLVDQLIAEREAAAENE